MSCRGHDRICCLCVLILAALLGVSCVSVKGPEKERAQIALVVMDPLAKELACACIKGYGQRDYRKVAARLQAALKERIRIEFSDDLAETLAVIGPTREVIVVGEQSLVMQGAQRAELKCHPVCELTGLDGSTTATGLFVARADDPVKELKEIGGRKLLVGLGSAEAKQAAVQAALRGAKLETPVELENRASSNDAALDVLDSSTSPLPVAVIPSYSLPLLEGCGSMKPGDLKVIGATAPVPFIAVFVGDSVPAEKREKILKTLLEMNGDAKMLKTIESRDGFKPMNVSGEPKGTAEMDWPDWRGPGRRGHVARLPTRLPERAKFIWKKAAMTGGLAGLSVSGNRLIMAERDFGEEHDVYRCLNAQDGELLWRVEFSAPGKLDYGQSPRATPVIHEGRAYLLGAFGELRCINVADGTLVWKRHLTREFQAELPTWGMCSTPLVVNDLLIVNPGATNASLVALDRVTGRTRWATPGFPAAYAAFIYGEFGGRRQIVGYDQRSLGGWDVKTGQRFWQLVPPTEGDFNVPTPIAVNGGVVVATENNGTRFYRFDGMGRIIPEPASAFAGLSPDTVTPVVTGGRLFGAHLGLRCLDLQNGMKPVWHREDDAVDDYATLIADDERVLVITLGGELILLDGKAEACVILSRLRVFEDDVEVYSHPALVGTRLYVRGGSNVVCVDLGTN